jgi:hypothetical protein
MRRDGWESLAAGLNSPWITLGFLSKRSEDVGRLKNYCLDADRRELTSNACNCTVLTAQSKPNVRDKIPALIHGDGAAHIRSCAPKAIPSPTPASRC